VIFPSYPVSTLAATSTMLLENLDTCGGPPSDLDSPCDELTILCGGRDSAIVLANHESN